VLVGIDLQHVRQAKKCGGYERIPRGESHHAGIDRGVRQSMARSIDPVAHQS
jgi:hypothetical protein